MDDDRWVHCRFCRQTYAAGRGERCSLCGKAGGLLDVPRPATPAADDRGSWAPGAGTSASATVAAGCLGILIGAFVGMMIAPTLLAGEPEQPAEAAKASNGGCGLGPGIAAVAAMVGGLMMGAIVGGAAGAFASVIIVTFATRFDRRPRAGPTEPTADGQTQ
jgi:hypothetical protein